jgi:hypothetical protein
LADIVSEQPTPLARPKPEPSVSRRRFGIAYLVLAAIVGAAVGLLVVFATGDDSHKATGPAWSAWAPQATGTRGVREIDRYVSSKYALPNGAQLLSPIGEPMVIPTEQGLVPVQAILIGSGNAGVRQQRVDVAFPEAGVLIQLCGTNRDCSIPSATASVARLVRREAVEIALYSFHYLPEADYMIVFLPPDPGTPQTSPRFHRAIYFDRPGLQAPLSAPLSKTLPPTKGKLTPEQYGAAEASAVDRIAAGRIYHYEIQPGATGAALMQLSPLVP